MGRRTTTKRLILVLALLCMAVTISGCADSGDSGKLDNEAAMNTIQPYMLSDAEYDLVTLAVPNHENAITQFAVDETYHRAVVGYDCYERGKLAAENCQETELPFTSDSGPQAVYGKICTYIDGEDVAINLNGKDGKRFEIGSVGSSAPLANEHLTLGDVSGISDITLGGPVEIEKSKKIYIFAIIGSNDDEYDISDVASLIDDEKALEKCEKCFAFYARFE